MQQSVLWAAAKTALTVLIHWQIIQSERRSALKLMVPGLYAIPTNLIMGFLGVGKTTAILHLLQNKPVHEKWAVLVNEFGKVGIDGAIYKTQGVFVKEVPGGCLCCAVGVPLQVAVNRLLKQAKPDRLLIEPSGLGHPYRILQTLSDVHFRSVLQIRASICLLDARKLDDSRYICNENFVDQIALADVLIANKVDLASPEDLQRFAKYCEDSAAGKIRTGQTVQGRVNRRWLDLPRHAGRKPRFSDVHAINPNSRKWQSYGQVFSKDTIFNLEKFVDWVEGFAPERMKAVLTTDQGCFIFNYSDGLMRVSPALQHHDNRVEFVFARSQWDDIKKALQSCIESTNL